MRAVVVLTVTLAIGAVAAATSGTAGGEESLSSIVRGGRLYDNWYKEIKEPPPTVPHPAYPADGKYATNSGVNWRCKECHGWDYRGRDGAYSTGEHHTGITGIRAMAGVEAARIIAVLKDRTHGYAGSMEDRDFRDLANFVGKGQVDMDRFIDRATAIAEGDKSKREAYFTTICANCHGKDGQKFRTMPPLGRVARSNPWQALHKILNGHPGENMPALRVLEMQVLVDILAYVQTLPAEELLSSIVRGGRLYDNWYKEIRQRPPTISHPAYPAGKKYAKDSGASWRCKECHGWDYRGRDGAYSTGEHHTGITGIRAMAGVEAARIIAVLKDRTHGYAGSMEDRDFRDLANFVGKGQVDMDRFIDRATAMAKGDKAKREVYFTTICANCHGKDGSRITTMPPLGKVARSNPWETLHKMLNGHPAEEMPSLRVLEMQVLADILAYAQTLPTGK